MISLEPISIMVVLDGEIVIYAANTRVQCNDHINDALDMEIEGAGQWIIREYTRTRVANKEPQP